MKDALFEKLELPQRGFQAKRKMAADKLQEPPSEWASIKAILDEYGLQAIDFVADFKAALAQPAQEPDLTEQGRKRSAILGNNVEFMMDAGLPFLKALETTLKVYDHPAPPKREWEEWNAALDEAAARIGEIKGFGQATQDSFAIYIKGLKK